MPRICRLSRPADNCHSNKYPLWVSAIDENARSLRPDIWRVNRQKEVYRGITGLFRKGSGFRICVASNGPFASKPASTFSPAYTEKQCGSGLDREGDESVAAESSWQSPTTDPPSNDAHDACHAHTTSRQFHRHESAAPTAVCRSNHGWPGRNPACRCLPCSAHR